jgi:DsbE subfamily thiol:disulfide oxidoreductase
LADPGRPAPRRRLLLVAVVAVAIPAVLLAVILAGQDSEDVGTRLRSGVGQEAPDFRLERLDDRGSVELSQFRGTPVVLTFFASWCHPCEEEMPLLEDAAQEHGRELAVIGVNYEDARSLSLEFAQELGVTFPTVYDDGGVVAERYGVVAIPQTLFIDERGVVRDRVYGITSKDALDEPLDALLDSS